MPRLIGNNATVVGCGLLTYWVLSASGLPAQRVNSACGCVVAGCLIVEMLFEGWPPWARRWGALALVAVVSAALFVLLTGIADTLSWRRATPADWVSYTTLNAIGLAVLLHVGIGRRWPLRAIRYTLLPAGTEPVVSNSRVLDDGWPVRWFGGLEGRPSGPPTPPWCVAAGE